MVKYINESVTILAPSRFNKKSGVEILKQLESYGRTCYKSRHLITGDSHLKYINMIMANGHLSVIEHVNITFLVVGNRGLSHELVRHRIASYSQESTRYCNYAKDKFGSEISVIDQSKHINPDGNNQVALDLWKVAMQEAEDSYMSLLDLGVPPQLARGVLPIDVKTEVVVTMNLRELGHMLKLRTSPAAHPNIRNVMVELWAVLRENIPIIFDDLSSFT